MPKWAVSHNALDANHINEGNISRFLHPDSRRDLAGINSRYVYRLPPGSNSPSFPFLEPKAVLDIFVASFTTSQTLSNIRHTQLAMRYAVITLALATAAAVAPSLARPVQAREDLSAREFDEELFTREFDEALFTREFDNELLARADFDKELLTHPGPNPPPTRVRTPSTSGSGWISMTSNEYLDCVYHDGDHVFL
ncbi:hypothetical protein C8Q72DRAFT_96737 [Fomitopsis betulina]|nr:hypothetical protein C8Q72DRAFT_96737 [Fomitopsis betulina]